MSNIGTIIASKNEKRGNQQVAALTAGHQKREQVRRDQERARAQQRQAGSNRRTSVPFFDGTDHINLWDRGETQIGRALSMEADINLHVEGLGRFRSFYALWVYLTTKHRTMAMRNAPAFQLRKMARERRDNDNYVEAPNARWIVLNALADYVVKDKDLADALIMTDGVPLLSYVVANGQRSLHSQAKWWIPFVQYIRAAMVGGLPIDDEYLSAMRETPGTYKEIVSQFRLDSNQLGRINRAPALAPAEKAPREPKKQKPVKVQREPKAQTQNEDNRKDKILGYKREDLAADFAGDNNKEVYVIKPIAEADIRRAFMWKIIGMGHTEAMEFLNSIPDGNHHNKSQHVYVFFDTSTGRCVRTSSSLIESPFLGDQDLELDPSRLNDMQLVASLSSSVRLVNMIQDERQNLRGDKKRLELRHRNGEHYWKVSRHPEAIARAKEVAPNREEAGIKDTVFLGAPLTEEQALTGKAPEGGVATGSLSDLTATHSVSFGEEIEMPAPSDEKSLQEVIAETQARSVERLNDFVGELLVQAEGIGLNIGQTMTTSGPGWVKDSTVDDSDPKVDESK